MGPHAKPFSSSGEDGEPVDFVEHAKASDRVRGQLQQKAPPVWSPVSESVQIHRVRGGSLSFGSHAVYSLESSSRGVGERPGGPGWVSLGGACGVDGEKGVPLAGHRDGARLLWPHEGGSEEAL